MGIRNQIVAVHEGEKNDLGIYIILYIRTSYLWHTEKYGLGIRYVLGSIKIYFRIGENNGWWSIKLAGGNWILGDNWNIPLGWIDVFWKMLDRWLL